MAEQRGTDLEAWETALRAAVLQAGAGCLAQILDGIGSGRPAQSVVCSCGQPMRSRGRKSKQLLTVLGPVHYRRSQFQCPACGATRYPGDEILDIVHTTRSPGLRRLMARAGSRTSFKEASKDLKIYAGLTVSPKDVERVAENIGQDIELWDQNQRSQLPAIQSIHPQNSPLPVLYLSYDGTGIPMVPQALQGRAGKQPDGSAKTREVKLGCVFTQTHLDSDKRPRRDPESTTYVAAIENAHEFGWRLYAEARRRGLQQAKKQVVIADGAAWIWNLAEIHFPNAIQILDLYHAREHVSDLIKILWPKDPKQIQRFRLDWWTRLDAGQVEQIIQQAQGHLPQDPEAKKAAQAQIAYLENNRFRMRYSHFRDQGLFVGSGVVEAGCKTLIGQRLKRSGMEWSLRGANAIIALRCNQASGRFEEYWEQRSA